MKKGFTGAFTMIELIFVIIILGILAVTALPKFVGIQDDAKIAAEQGVIGAVRGGISLSHSKWLLKEGDLDWDGDGATENFSSTGYLLNLETGGAYNEALTAGTVFQEVLSEPAEAWTKTVIDLNSTRYEGPATKDDIGVKDEGTNDINKSGGWIYSNTSGRIPYSPNGG